MKLPGATNASISWARQGYPQKQAYLAVEISKTTSHWSRTFEYSWVLANGDFQKGQWVLDAAGGDAPLQYLLAGAGVQVINVDSDPSSQPKWSQGILSCVGNLCTLAQIQDGVFDQVMCVSVLEHISKPWTVLPELWRVLKPGGKLIGSFDVASYARHNHTIDLAVAATLLDYFGLAVPAKPADVLSMEFPELQDGHGGNPTVMLNVLCFCVTKGVTGVQ